MARMSAVKMDAVSKTLASRLYVPRAKNVSRVHVLSEFVMMSSVRWVISVYVAIVSLILARALSVLEVNLVK